MLDQELKTYLESEGYVQLRGIPGRGICGLHSFMFTTGIMYGIDESGYKGRWCYPSVIEAVVAFDEWDGVGDPPRGWIKYKGDGGERTNPNNNGTE